MYYIRYPCIYIVHMSSTLSESLVLYRIKLSDVLEIHYGIIFGFHPGLLHMYIQRAWPVFRDMANMRT